MKTRIIFGIFALAFLGLTAITHSEVIGIITGLFMGGALLIDVKEKRKDSEL